MGAIEQATEREIEKEKEEKRRKKNKTKAKSKNKKQKNKHECWKHKLKSNTLLAGRALRKEPRISQCLPRDLVMVFGVRWKKGQNNH